MKATAVSKVRDYNTARERLSRRGCIIAPGTMLGCDRVGRIPPTATRGPSLLMASPDSTHRRSDRRGARRRRRVNRVLASLLMVATLWSFHGAASAQETDQPAPTAPDAGTTPPTPASKPPAKKSPPAADSQDDARHLLRGAVGTRGPDESKVGIALAAEMRSALPWGLEGGPGVEVDLWQSQTDSNIFSYLPVYWALDYRPVRRYQNAFVSGRFGFDILGQEGDDTLASRSYYALGIGLVTGADRPRNLVWELIYSRIQGAFTGVAFSVGYRF